MDAMGMAETGVAPGWRCGWVDHHAVRTAVAISDPGIPCFPRLAYMVIDALTFAAKSAYSGLRTFARPLS